MAYKIRKRKRRWKLTKWHKKHILVIIYVLRWKQDQLLCNI